MKIKIFILLFLCFGQWASAQTEKLVNGKIIVKDATPEGVRVINLSNEKEVLTDRTGAFSILAKADDLLVFSAVHLDYMRKIVEQSDYDSGNLIISMTSKIIELEQVEVIDYDLNAVSLGILTKEPKRYTTAERRLRTATAAYPTLYAGTMAGGSVGLDPLLNWISGRTAMLKKELTAERKILLLQKLQDVFEDNFYTETLQIASDHIRAFQYYSIYDSELEAALNSKNKILTTFLMIRLATEFNAKQQDEK